jgi:hypothetical protein
MQCKKVSSTVPQIQSSVQPKSMQRVLRSALRQAGQIALASSCLIASMPIVSHAQNGVTIFSGVERKDELSYRLDFNGDRGNWDRYRLRVNADKMKLSVAQFIIRYPDYYTGKFDTKDVELMVDGKPWKVQEVNWDQDNNRLEIYPAEAVPAKANVEMIFSNVKNPDNPGVFYFECLIQAPGDVPIMRQLGTWIITIS